MESKNTEKTDAQKTAPTALCVANVKSVMRHGSSRSAANAILKKAGKTIGDKLSRRDELSLFCHALTAAEDALEEDEQTPEVVTSRLELRGVRRRFELGLR